jgi:ubiquinone/menaquinone biosynthesis C-methylase UbiE
MTFITTLKKKLSHRLRVRETPPAKAYNLWASSYDAQPDNPILLLDGLLFNQLLSNINLEGKRVVDIGCGTGRHWEALFRGNVAECLGYEASTEMLQKVREKYPHARTFLHSGHALKELEDRSCDVLVSTLVIAHIRNLSAEWREWNRVLKNGGEILLTDFHPVALQRGANRSFMYRDRLVYIKNHVHTLDMIRHLAGKLNWKEIGFIESRIDERVKHIFERLDVMEAYRDSYDQLVLYGLHLKKEI